VRAADHALPFKAEQLIMLFYIILKVLFNFVILVFVFV